MEKKILIIGLGNEYITDDGVGIKTVRELQKKLTDNEEVPSWYKIKIEERAVGGLALLDDIIGNDICIIVDAVFTKENKAGTIYRFVQRIDQELTDIKSSHQISLSQVLSLAKLLNVKLPRITVIYGIEVADIYTFSESCTPVVEKNVKNLAEFIYNDLVNFNIEKISDEPLSIYFDEEIK